MTGSRLSWPTAAGAISVFKSSTGLAAARPFALGVDSSPIGAATLGVSSAVVKACGEVVLWVDSTAESTTGMLELGMSDMLD